MNETIKTIWTTYHSYIVVGLVFIFCVACVWLYADRNSRIDTSPIQHATEELRHAGEYNRQSVEYNQRIRTAVVHSETLNDRITTSVNRSLESATRAETAIDRSTELIKRTREDAANAKTIIRESRDILKSAKRDNQESTTPEPQF